MSYVCSNCFEDKTARQFIRKNGTLGDCDFCGSKHRKVLQARQLRDLFEELINLYRMYDPAPGTECWDGETLAECLKDWEIFSEVCEKKIQNAILDDIMGFDRRDGDLSAFDDWEAKSDHWTTNPLHMRWSWFADYVKRHRRFIIEEDTAGEIMHPESWVPDLLVEAHAIRELKENKRLFRGRLGRVDAAPPRGGETPLPPEQMGAPPPKLAKAGRANPEGISFLYCALEPETAIVETGRFPGAVVSLRELRTRQPLRLADLTDRRSVLEPLATNNLADEVRNRTLLGSLGRALGEPVHPEDSSIEYIPTQYLAEVIRSVGYDGICFSSALKPEGTNIVLFNPAHVRITQIGWVFTLGRADYTIHPNPKCYIGRGRRLRLA
ncbi:MAG: RES domain-containing protein [Chthoniobacteraceae bacterium]|jgi:hypothetical protein